MYPASQAMKESHQIGQAWLPLDESILTTPDYLLFFHLLDDDFQNELLHHLSQNWGKADWPVVPWVLLLALSEVWSDIGLSPVLRHLSCPPGHFKDDGEWLSKDICQVPQHSWVHSIGAHGFVGIQIVHTCHPMTQTPLQEGWDLNLGFLQLQKKWNLGLPLAGWIL